MFQRINVSLNKVLTGCLRRPAVGRLSAERLLGNASYCYVIDLSVYKYSQNFLPVGYNVTFHQTTVRYHTTITVSRALIPTALVKIADTDVTQK